MKRRITLIVIIVLVITGLVLGIRLYLKRNESSRLLRGAELALSADNPQKALDMINKYTLRHPDDWKGICVLARVQMRLGRYQEARDRLNRLLQEQQLGDDERLKVLLDLNDSYAYPAQQRMALPQTRASFEDLQSIIDDFQHANAFLQQTKPTNAKDTLIVQETLANHLSAIGYCQDVMADIRAHQADTAEVAADQARAAELRQKSHELRSEGRKNMEQAIESYLHVFREDPERGESARRLIELCRILNDQEHLAAAREILAKCENPPLEAVILMLRQELDVPDQGDIGTTMRRIDTQKIRQVSEKLEQLLAQHPDEEAVQLECADMALRLQEFDRAQNYLTPVLEKNPRQAQARTLQAQLWLAQGDIAKAEKEFFSLKTEMPHSSELQFYYGQAALAGGKKELARQAMRIAGNINTKDPRPRFYLAQSLLEDGFYDQAFVDAKACYEASPGDPTAVSLFVRSAYHTRQPELLRKTIEQTAKEYSRFPEMLAVVAEGFRLLDNKASLRDTMHALTQCAPQNPRETALIAEAFLYLDQNAQAENLLLDGLKQYPDHPDLNFKLGQLFAQTDRSFQAEEYFRRALQKETQQRDHIRLELAQALISSDDPEQALQVLNDIEKATPRANLLRLQANMMKGETPDPDQALGQTSDVNPLGAALTFFYSDQFDQCAKICQAELAKNPDDQQTRSLLAQTYQRQKEYKKSTEQWSQLIQSYPRNMFYYFSLARLLNRDHAPEVIEKKLGDIPNVNPDQIGMTMGWLYEQNRRYDEALRQYTRIVDRPGVEEQVQDSVRLLRARVWALQGKIEDALKELNFVTPEGNLRQRALLTQIRLLIAVRQPQRAVEPLQELEQMAEQKENLNLYKNVVGFYAQMDMTDEALAVCERMEKMFPRNPGVYLQRAAVWQKLQRVDDAVADYRRAVECQPGDLGLQRQLVRALDEQRNLDGALAVLKEVETIGQTGQVMALYERGMLFSRWGLPAQSLECFNALAQTPQGQNPRVQLVLANTFAQLDHKDKALDILKSIPDYSNEYIPAQLLLVRLTDNCSDNLRRLESLRTAYPDRSDILAGLVQTYLDADRPGDALAALKTFFTASAEDVSIPAELNHVIMQTLAAAKKQPAALELAQQLAGAKPAPWNMAAIFIALDQAPQQAAGMLPPVEQAGVYDTVLGLCQALLAEQPQAARSWAQRLDSLQEQLQKLNPPQRVPGEYGLLARLALGQLEDAVKFQEANRARITIDGSITQELLDASRTKINRPEILRLLQAGVAMDAGLMPFCRDLALQTLQARPACQWAAALLISAQPDLKTLEQATSLLEPKNSLMAQIYQSQIYSFKGEHQQAADLLGRIAQTSSRRADMDFRLAAALENAGRYEQALELYRRLWQEDGQIAAANNGAYMVTLISPDDKTQLQQARQWIDAAVKAAPQQAAFQETRGWIALLQGEKDSALSDLRQTIQALADSPEAHYHLALAEKAHGHTPYARWHLQAAMDLVQKARKENPPPASLDMIFDRAQKTLAELGPDEAENPS